jgi:hypothetical protein
MIQQKKLQDGGVDPYHRSFGDSILGHTGSSATRAALNAVANLQEMLVGLGPLRSATGEERDKAGPPAKGVHPEAPGLPEDNYRMRPRILETTLAMPN